MQHDFPFLAGTNKTLALAACVALLYACGGSDDNPAPLKTLDGAAPIVIAHRGASGYLPEETLEAYQKAIELGADAVEPDLISTADGVLIARHDPELSVSTDVASHPEFAARKRKRTLDGVEADGWWAVDFTFAEIQTLGAISTDAERPQQYNGRFHVISFQQLLDLVAQHKAATGRDIAVYPETKNPTFHRDLGLPIEDKLIAMVEAAGLNSKTAPIYVQSFEPSSLKYLKAHGLETKLIQLVDGDDYDFANGTVSNPDSSPFARPYDWAKAGDTRKFTAMLTPAGLAEVKTYADGIGPWKPYIVPVKGRYNAAGEMQDLNGDGKTNLNDAETQAPTALIADAHAAGLFLHPYTFRNEQRRLAYTYHGDPQAEYLQFFRLGVDGLFSDFADTALTARAAYLKETGR